MATTWDPNGASGTDVAAAGTTLATVNKVGTGTMVYDSTAGFNRGNNIGAKLQVPLDTDQANVTMTTTSAAMCTAYAYFRINALPTSGAALPILDIRSSTTNLIRAAIAPSGLLTCQTTAGGNPGGVLGGTLYTLALNTIYRVQLSVDPGVATVTPFDGVGTLTLYDNSDAVLFTGTITNGNFGVTAPATLRFGDASGAAGQGAGTIIQFTQLAIETHATVMPVIPPVPENAAPPASVANFPRIMVSGLWV